MSYLILNEIGNSEKGQRFLNNVVASKRGSEFIKRERANDHQETANRERVEKRNGIDSRHDSTSKEVHGVRDRNFSGLLTSRSSTGPREEYPPNHPESNAGQARKWNTLADRDRKAANKFESYADRARERHGDLDPERKDKQVYQRWEGTKVLANHQSHLSSDVGRGDFKTKRIFGN